MNVENFLKKAKENTIKKAKLNTEVFEVEKKLEFKLY